MLRHNFPVFKEIAYDCRRNFRSNLECGKNGTKNHRQCIHIRILSKNSVCLFCNSLLRYNHTPKKFTHLKCTIRCFLYIHKVVQLQLTSISRCFFSLQKETLQYSSPPPANPKNPLLYFLSLWLCLVWDISCKRFKQCVWSFLFSGFIHVVACVRTFLFIPKYYPIIWVYHIVFIPSSVAAHLGYLTF